MVFRKFGEEKILKFLYDFQVSLYISFMNTLKYFECQFFICYPINNLEMADSQLHMVIKNIVVFVALPCLG